MEEFDVSSAFSAFFAVKDDAELVSGLVLMTGIGSDLGRKSCALPLGPWLES